MLVERATAELDTRLVTVMDKRLTAPSGDRHDYYALSPYFWPTPGSPNGQAFVFRDGQVNPAADTPDYDRRSYFRMGDAVTYMAVAYDTTKEARYAAGPAALAAGLVRRARDADESQSSLRPMHPRRR